MPHSRSVPSHRVLQAACRWLQNRWQECVRCSECDQPVLPFDTLCSNCGQAHPAKISAWAGIYLLVCVGLVAVLGALLI